MIDTSVPVLVLNAIHYGALGLTRTLGRLGVTVLSQAPHRFVPVFFSRYSRRNIVWDVNAHGAEKTIEHLIALGRQLGRPAVLIPTCDVTALLVADHDAALREWFVFPQQRPEVVHTLCSKRGLFNVARSLGIATPETSFPESRAEMLHFVGSVRFPLVLKTIENRLGENALRGIKIIVHDRETLIRRYDELEDPEHPNLMLQEYIPGNDDRNCMFNGYFNVNSDCLFGIAGRKIRQFPPYAGVTSLGVCCRNEFVEKSVKDFMKAIGYRGALDCGYRFDVRDGKYKVYDVNPRLGATFRLFVDNLGLDVARALYLDVTGQPVQAGVMQEGRTWIVEDIDLVSSLRYFSDRRLSLMDWTRSLRGLQETAIFAGDDPLPIVGRASQHLHTLLRAQTRPRKRRDARVREIGAEPTVSKQPGTFT
jgi:D-aspartate ligase